MPTSAWWSRTRGLDRSAYAAWTTSLAEDPGRPARILAWARGPEGYVIGSPAALSWGAAEPVPGAGAQGPPATAAGGVWSHVGWHEIERGGWNSETAKLSWALYGGRRGSVGLDEPGRLPELFRERIAATIAVERFVPVSGDRGVIVTARRDLGTDGVISWHTTLTRGLTWQTDGVRALADDALARLRTEFDLR